MLTSPSPPPMTTAATSLPSKRLIRRHRPHRPNPYKPPATQQSATRDHSPTTNIFGGLSGSFLFPLPGSPWAPSVGNGWPGGNRAQQLSPSSAERDRLRSSACVPLENLRRSLTPGSPASCSDEEAEGGALEIDDEDIEADGSFEPGCEQTNIDDVFSTSMSQVSTATSP